MKKLRILLIAVSLVFGMTQCKKNVETVTPSDLVRTVHITLNVGDNGKQVDPSTGAVVYGDGDVIYVGDGSKYLGTLTYGSGAFSGYITEPEAGAYLYFYFLGGLTLPSPDAGTTSYIVSIADQSTKLPVLSFGRSTKTYTDGNATYRCTLLNKCGLVKFNLSVATDRAVAVGGLYTTATIDFATPGITPEGTTGSIILRNEGINSERWAILLPQDAINNPTVTIAGFTSELATLGETTVNMYNNTGENITMSVSGILPGVFSVADGRTVQFSQGNLQYRASTDTWRFAEHQYDYIGGNNTKISSTYSGFIDLFGWGTSGYDHGAICYQPWSTSNDDNNYKPYGAKNMNLYDGSGKADWGYNAISNGGNTENLGWRTLTGDEWLWVLGPSKVDAVPGNNCRKSSTVNGVENARFAKTKVNGTKGLIVFPDSYTHPDGVAAPANGSINVYGIFNWNDDNYSVDDWGKMEAAGCVFLPDAGYRLETSVYDVGSGGRYWSSAYKPDLSAYCVRFVSDYVATMHDSFRYRGLSVRLVR